MLVKSTHGLIQKHEEEAWILYRGYTLFLNNEELDELKTLIDVYQQEMSLEQSKSAKE